MQDVGCTYFISNRCILQPFDILYGHLVYFTAILWSFCMFNGYLVHFSPFWYVVARKIWQPCYQRVDGIPGL
jgi:hypothetical protein